MNQPEINTELETAIPQKLYFRIGEVSRLVGVKPYVLRYWETEFQGLSPNKSGSGHRFYRRKDVELLLQIKQLLYEKRFTIEGARRHLETQAKTGRRERAVAAAAHSRPVPPAQPDLFPPPAPDLQALRDELAAILDLLK
jgi:DNA-binding transcriptional MerR regulator